MRFGRLLSRKVQKNPKPLQLRAFYEKRNKVLILREVGGLGDILMQRMMFEDFKRVMPDIELHWGVPSQFFEAAKHHPFVDKVLNCNETDVSGYVSWHNITTACGRYETTKAPNADLHRSDIWANHCGVCLTKHNMHIKIIDKEYGINQIKKLKTDGPSVVICPISAMTNKNLTSQQLISTIDFLQKKGYYVYGLHHSTIPEFKKMGVHCFSGTTIPQWMSLIDAADYVVSVDSAALHLAGGMGKPAVGIFTFVDGYVYCKYYPTVEIVQLHRNTHPHWTCGPCYNWTNCPKTKAVIKPCLTEITPSMIEAGIEKMIKKWPVTL